MLKFARCAYSFMSEDPSSPICGILTASLLFSLGQFTPTLLLSRLLQSHLFEGHSLVSQSIKVQLIE